MEYAGETVQNDWNIMNCSAKTVVKHLLYSAEYSGLRSCQGLLHEYIGHDVSNMRGFDSYRLLTLSLAALMTRISSAMIEGAHTSAGAATLARTVPFWGRFRSPREPTAGPCRGCLLPSATNTAPSRHHLQAVLCDGWDVQTPPSWLLRPQTRELYGWS